MPRRSTPWVPLLLLAGCARTASPEAACRALLASADAIAVYVGEGAPDPGCAVDRFTPRRFGFTEDTAVSSLQCANAVLERCAPDREREVEVRVLPGEHVGASVEWTYTAPRARITVRPAHGRVVFDGCDPGRCRPPGPEVCFHPPCPAICEPDACVDAPFFRLAAGRGARTNVHLEGLVVRRYPRAVHFGAPRGEGGTARACPPGDLDCRPFAATWNGGNAVRGCRFESIGSWHRQDCGEETAAVALVNSRENLVANNVFEDVRSWCEGHCERSLHAVYLFRGARDNRIVGNTFRRVSGSAVKLRHGSDGNALVGNRFECAGYRSRPGGALGPPAVWQTFDPRRGECAPRGTVMERNVLAGSLCGVALEPVVSTPAFEGPPGPACPRADAVDTPWFEVRDNRVEAAAGCEACEVDLPPRPGCAPREARCCGDRCCAGDCCVGPECGCGPGIIPRP